MKLVLLEALVIITGIRTIQVLLGHAPVWPASVWEFMAGFALVSIAMIGVQALREKRSPATVAPPHIPLARIGPFTLEATNAPVRFGARGDHNINLN